MEDLLQIPGGIAVNPIQKYELIRPILKGEKTPRQVSEERDVPLSNIYRYLKQFQEGDGKMESLADKSHAIDFEIKNSDLDSREL